jgi:hypothetical protein
MAGLQIRLRINPYELVREAVEAGVNYGYHRAHKHVEKPDESVVVDTVTQEVMNNLCELLDLSAFPEDANHD